MLLSRARLADRVTRVVLLAAVCIVALLAAAAATRGGALPVVAGYAAPAATPTIDPRLIIRPRTERVTATLSRGVRLSGTLYPAYPGRNTVWLELRQGSRALSGIRRVTLAATMPGMSMTPVRATLTLRRGRYGATITLPMFGTYRAAIVVQTRSGRYGGYCRLVLALPRFG